MSRRPQVWRATPPQSLPRPERSRSPPANRPAKLPVARTPIRPADATAPMVSLSFWGVGAPVVRSTVKVMYPEMPGHDSHTDVRAKCNLPSPEELANAFAASQDEFPANPHPSELESFSFMKPDGDVRERRFHLWSVLAKGGYIVP